MSYPIALIMMVFFSERRTIAYKNLQLCFPEKSIFSRWILLFTTIRSTFLGLVEAGIVWNYPDKARNISHVVGLDHIPKDRGAMLMSYHHLVCLWTQHRFHSVRPWCFPRQSPEFHAAPHAHSSHRSSDAAPFAVHRPVGCPLISLQCASATVRFKPLCSNHLIAYPENSITGVLGGFADRLNFG